jgi:ABC-2 type transport system ATP-binding protein
LIVGQNRNPNKPGTVPAAGNSAPPSAVVVANQVSKRYGRTAAVHQCDLAIPEGAFVALVGPNGAGKSTLLLMLVGLLRPSSGELLVLGKQPSKYSADILAHVSVVLQDRPLYESLTVRETLEMGRRLNDRWDGALGKIRVERLGIPLDRRISKLSGGQQAQVALTIALAKRPSLLILDEPMASLDPLARQQFIDEVTTAAQDDGITVIMSSHVIAELARVCDYVVVLQNGRVAASGRVQDVVARWSAIADRDSQERVSGLEAALLGYMRRGGPDH